MHVILINIHLILVTCRLQHLQAKQLEACSFLGCSDPTRTSPTTFGKANPTLAKRQTCHPSLGFSS